MQKTSPLKDGAVGLSGSALLVLRKLMEYRDLSPRDVARRIGWDVEELERWLAAGEEVRLEDFLAVWAVLVSRDEEGDLLESFTDVEPRRDTSGTGAAPVPSPAPAGDVDELLEGFFRALQMLVDSGLVDPEQLDYLGVRSGLRRTGPDAVN